MHILLEGRDDMGGLSVIKDKVMGLVDVIMPPLDDVDELEADVRRTDKQPAVHAVANDRASSSSSYTEEYKVSNGGSIQIERPSYTADFHVQTEKSRPQLTGHTTKTSELKVQIYAPRNFDQVTAIADDLKDGKACVVNYEKIEADEQRRICDFVNGVCYVLDGCAKRVSGQIVLYVPNGVDVAEAMTLALTD